MVSVNVCSALCAGAPESVTSSVKVALPEAVGVPDNRPELVSVSPAGRLPEEMLHV